MKSAYFRHKATKILGALWCIRLVNLAPLYLILFYPSQAWIKHAFIFAFLLGFEVLFEGENKDFYYIKS